MLEKFTIGQLANLFNINIQTLYYYDKAELLVPYYRSPGTGLRCYSFKQVQQLSSILYLKKCGFSLNEIKEIQRNLTPQTAKEKLIQKSEEIMKQWKEIVRLDKAIHSKLAYVDEERMKIEKENAKVLYRKKRYFIKTGVEEIAYCTEYLYYHPVVVCYFPNGKVFGALLEKDDDIEIENMTVNTIPNGDYLIAYHKGPYSTIYERQEKIIQENPDLQFTGDIYTFDIIDQMNCSNQEEFLTKMEFQIKK
jgi:DNA-binding transcriptional MerR regulator